MKDILITITNFALIKSSPEESYFASDLIGNVRTILNNINSFNCRRKKVKLTDIQRIKIRLQRYLRNTKSHFNVGYYRKRLYHYCYKALKYKHKNLGRLYNDQLIYLNDQFEDWEDGYQFAWLDHHLTFLEDLIEVSLLAEEFQFLIKYLNNTSLIPQDNYYSYSSHKLLSDLSSTYNLDLLKAFKLNITPDYC